MPSSEIHQKRPWPPWRLPGGTNNASESALNRVMGSCERWEYGCAAAVIGGLFLEFVIALANPPYGETVERWGTVACDFAVALGVVGETWFAARSAHCQGILTQRSNNRLADTEELLAETQKHLAETNDAAADALHRAAVAQMRAAKLEKEAAEARERTAEIERLTAWRRVTPDLREAVKTGLMDFGSGRTVAIEFQRSDPEAFNFARELAFAFTEAGVTSMDVLVTANDFLDGIRFGQHIWIDPRWVSAPLVSALIGAGCHLNVMLHPASGYEGQRDIYLFIGPKVPWNTAPTHVSA